MVMKMIRSLGNPLLMMLIMSRGLTNCHKKSITMGRQCRIFQLLNKPKEYKESIEIRRRVYHENLCSL
jgi:hypothetical protein